VKSNLIESLAPRTYILWTPEESPVAFVGPEQHSVSLPVIPYPLSKDRKTEEPPTPNEIGTGIYDYLRQFPECPHNVQYAEILREAFPHFLADLGSQIAMLDHKEVDSPYVRRKITYLKILALLEPDNHGLLQTLGMSCYDLALMFTELSQCHHHLQESAHFFRRADARNPANATNLNYLGQIEYFLGDYPAAIRAWSKLMACLKDDQLKKIFADRIANLEKEQMPEQPLFVHLEAIGAAMEAYGQGHAQDALEILEYLEEQTPIPTEFPSPQFYYLLGLCRQNTGDAGGAFVAFEKALDLDPHFHQAEEAMNALSDKGER